MTDKEKSILLEKWGRRFPSLNEDQNQVEVYYELWNLCRTKSRLEEEQRAIKDKQGRVEEKQQQQQAEQEQHEQSKFRQSERSEESDPQHQQTGKEEQEQSGIEAEKEREKEKVGEAKSMKKYPFSFGVGARRNSNGKNKKSSSNNKNNRNNDNNNKEKNEGKNSDVFLHREEKEFNDRLNSICCYEDLVDVCNWGEDEEMVLLRYLQAEKYDIDKAIAHLRLTLTWRRTEKVNILRNQPVADILSCTEDELLKYYPRAVTGFDKLGRPIIIQKFSAFEVWNIKKITSLESVIKHHIWEQEHTCALLYSQSLKHQRNISQFCIVVDIENMALSTVTSEFLFLVKSIASIDQNHYPERMGATYIINCPTVFPMVWNIVKHWLDTKTTSKIKILKGKDEWLPIFQQAFDPDQLPLEYGGTQASFFLPRESLVDELHPNLIENPRATLPIVFSSALAPTSTATSTTISSSSFSSEFPSSLDSSPNRTSLQPSDDYQIVGKGKEGPIPSKTSSSATTTAANINAYADNNKKILHTNTNTNPGTPTTVISPTASLVTTPNLISTKSSLPSTASSTTIPPAIKSTNSIDENVFANDPFGNTPSPFANKPLINPTPVFPFPDPDSDPDSEPQIVLSGHLSEMTNNENYLEEEKSNIGDNLDDSLMGKLKLASTSIPTIKVPTVDVPTVNDLSQKAHDSINSLREGVDSSVNTASQIFSSIIGTDQHGTPSPSRQEKEEQQEQDMKNATDDQKNINKYNKDSSNGDTNSNPDRSDNQSSPSPSLPPPPPSDFSKISNRDDNNYETTTNTKNITKKGTETASIPEPTSNLGFPSISFAFPTFRYEEQGIEKNTGTDSMAIDNPKLTTIKEEEKKKETPVNIGVNGNGDRSQSSLSPSPSDDSSTPSFVFPSLPKPW